MTGKTLRRLSAPILLSVGLVAALGTTVAGAQVAQDPPGNPDLLEACGLDFTLVIDRSGSVAGNATTVENAAKAFLDALVDTGSNVSLVSFATSATVDSVATPLTTANLAGLKSEVDYTFADYTNWEDGLLKAQSTFGGFADGEPDLVVMITDGVPNRWINGGVQGSGSAVSATALSEAVGQANTIKAGGTHMFALGVGGDSGLNETSLKAISSTPQWPEDTSFDKAGWTKKSFADLKPTLIDIATELCGGTVIVHKLVDGVAKPDWHFSATNGATATPGTGDTDVDGKVQFDWDSAQDTATNVTETLKDGYSFLNASCTRRGGGAVGSPITKGVALTVGPLDTILCEFNNHKLTTGIHVEKSASPTQVIAGTNVTYSIVVTNPAEAPLSSVTVSDPQCSPLVGPAGDTGSDGILNPGESWTYTCSKALAVDTLNTATATGTPPVGPNVSDDDDAVVDVVNPLLHIAKTGPAQAHEGDEVTYTFTVTNTGDVTLTDLTVSDDVLGTIGTIESLEAGGSAELTKKYIIPAGRTANVVNTATVCTDGPAPGTAQDAEPLCDTEIHVLDVLHPSVTIDKTANPLTIDGSGDVTFSYKVTNTGDIALTGVKVTDDKLGDIATIGNLAVGESKTVTKTVSVNTLSPTINIGTAVGEDPLGRKVSDDDDAVIKVNPVVVAAEVQGETLVAAPVTTTTTAAPAVAPAVAGTTLPTTGSNPRTLVFIGLVLLLAGLATKVGVKARRA